MAFHRSTANIQASAPASPGSSTCFRRHHHHCRSRPSPFPGCESTIIPVGHQAHPDGRAGHRQCPVSRANTVALTFVNPTAGAIDAASQPTSSVFARLDLTGGGLP